MFKALANVLHRTPWWAMALIGILSFIGLVLFTIPFQVIRLEKAGATAAENQAIKREVDAAFASQGLDVAEGFIKAFKSRTNDPVRQVELENALEEIQRAREEIEEAGRLSAEARREAERAVQEAGQEAQRSMREAAREARKVARDNLLVAAEASVDSAQAALEGQRQALKALREAGVKDAQAEAQLNAGIRSAEESLAKARRKLEAAKRDTSGRGLRIGIGTDKPAFEIEIGDKDAAETAADKHATDVKGLPAPPAPPKAPQAAKSPQPPVAPKAAVAPASPASPAAPAAPPEPAAAPAPPAPPSAPALPREFRADIREKVADDFFRLTFGAILIITFIPLFIIAVISKFFIDRARAAQRVAEEKKKEADIHSMNRQVVEARLMALQAQVEPHFLYNTLANVQALCEADPPLASKMVEHLIQYLRAALPKMRETSSTVGQEMDLVRAYLNILKIRMGARLEFSIDMPDDVAKLPFPPLMLPSLIENAIKHGLEPQREGGRIDITARRENGTVTIEVKDTGRGFGTGTSGGGVGLANIRERLAGLYGEQAALVMAENEPQGVIATLRVPDTPPREIGAMGAAPLSGVGLGRASSAPAAPTTLAGKVWGGVKTAHNIWAKVAGYTFVVLMSIIGIGLVITLIGNFTGLMPLEIGDARIGGLHGVAVGTLITLVVFTVLAIVALVVVALVYGLGVMAAFLLVLIPLLILVGSFPALAPFIVIGGIVWWVMRKKKKEPELPTLKR